MALNAAMLLYLFSLERLNLTSKPKQRCLGAVRNGQDGWRTQRNQADKLIKHTKRYCVYPDPSGKRQSSITISRAASIHPYTPVGYAAWLVLFALSLLSLGRRSLSTALSPLAPLPLTSSYVQGSAFNFKAGISAFITNSFSPSPDFKLRERRPRGTLQMMSKNYPASQL